VDIIRTMRSSSLSEGNLARGAAELATLHYSCRPDLEMECYLCQGNPAEDAGRVSSPVRNRIANHIH